MIDLENPLMASLGFEALQSIEDPFLLWHRHLHANGLALETFDHGTTLAAMAMANRRTNRVFCVAKTL